MFQQLQSLKFCMTYNHAHSVILEATVIKRHVFHDMLYVSCIHALIICVTYYIHPLLKMCNIRLVKSQLVNIMGKLHQ